MKKKSKKTNLSISDSFKLGVVGRVANGQVSREEARQTFGIGAMVPFWNG